MILYPTISECRTPGKGNIHVHGEAEEETFSRIQFILIFWESFQLRHEKKSSVGLVFFNVFAKS